MIILDIVIIRIILHISDEEEFTSALIDIYAKGRFIFSISKYSKIHIWDRRNRAKIREICEIPERIIWDSYLALTDSTERLLCMVNDGYISPDRYCLKSAYLICIHSPG